MFFRSPNKCPSQITRDTCSDVESKLISAKCQLLRVGSATLALAILTYLGKPVGTVGVVPAPVGLGMESLPGIDVGVLGTVVAPGVVGTLRLPGLDEEPSVPESVELVLELGVVVLSGVVFIDLLSPAGAAVASGLVIASGFFMPLGAIVFLPFFILALAGLAIVVATVVTWEDV